MGEGVGASIAPPFRGLRPLPPPHSLKGRRRIFLGRSDILMPMGRRSAWRYTWWRRGARGINDAVRRAIGGGLRLGRG